MVELDISLDKRFKDALELSHQRLQTPEFPSGEDVADGALGSQDGLHADELRVPARADVLVESPGARSGRSVLDLYEDFKTTSILNNKVGGNVCKI